MKPEFLDHGYKRDLLIHPPVCNAPGSLGFAPDTRKPICWDQFGSFFTNPVSWQPRSPAAGERFRKLPGGFMLHTGHPNPGFFQLIRQFSSVWSRAEMPIIIHLLVEREDWLQRMVERLESLDNIQAIELGFPPDVDTGMVSRGVKSAMGELPIISMLPFESDCRHAEVALEAGAVAVSLAPPRVLLPAENGFVSGRLYGRAVFPLLLGKVQRLIREQVPVIAGGGVYTGQQAESLLRLGVKAVQLDAVLWREPEIKLSLSDELP